MSDWAQIARELEGDCDCDELRTERAQLRELAGFLIDACATHRIDVPLHSSLLDLAADIAGGVDRD